MTHGGVRDRDSLKKFFQKPAIAKADIFAVQQIFHAAGATAAAEAAVSDHLQKARHCLAQLEPAIDATALRELIEMILKRKA
jgi:geranylgeranyl pyrophosphate synthase